VLDRLVGTETEYALRFSPAPGVDHPGNEHLFEAIRDAVDQLVDTHRSHGALDSARGRVFTQNGGSLYYEFLPTSLQGGLVEAGTPECRGPGQLLVYQRAWDHLLAEAVERAEATLSARGIRGELSLIKNCRDAEGHVYGAQENYEVPIAEGAALLGWRLGVLVAVPVALLGSISHWLLLLTLLAVSLPVGMTTMLYFIAVSMAGRPAAAVERDVARVGATLTSSVARLEGIVGAVEMLPTTLIVGVAARLFAFRPHRRGALAFLASRSVISGAGTLGDDGRWQLSEKAPAIRRLMRWTVSPGDRGLLEIGHLSKGLQVLFLGDWRGPLRLLGQRQRLQLGLSDANRCDVAEFLKTGTTALVLDMVEAGVLDDAPQLLDPVGAARQLAADPGLGAEVMLRDGQARSALQLQRFYLDRARAWLAEQEAVNLEAHDLVRLWGEALDLLATEPNALVGRLDWVTKRVLVRTAHLDDDPVAAKKVDLRYHELGRRGYHGWLVDEGLATVLVEPAEAYRAARTPPSDSPARHRGRMVQQLAATGAHAHIGWEDVRLGGPLRGKVIPFDRARRRDPAREP